MPVNIPIRKQNQAGTGFTNLQRVLQANKSNRLGATVGAGIQKAGQQAVGAINQAGQQFKTEAEKERQRQTGIGETVRGTLGGDLTNVNDNTVSQFESARSGQSKGPNQIINADQVASQAREAQGLGQATGNEGGRLGLLQRFVGQGNRYTGGQQRLDNLLLGQTGQKDLTQSRRGTFGLNTQVANQQAAAGEVGKELQSGAQNLKDTTIAGLQGKVTDYDAAMQAKATQAAADREAKVKEILSGDLNVEEPIYNQLKEAGIEQNTDYLNTELNDYVKANNDLANKRAIQEQADFDKVQALSKLSGQDLADKQALLDEYKLSGQDVGTFSKSNMFKIPSAIELNDARQKLANEYGAKKAGTDERTRAALSNLVVERPGSPGYAENGAYGALIQEYASPVNFAKRRLEQLGKIPGGPSSPEAVELTKALSGLTATGGTNKGQVDNAAIMKYMPENMRAIAANADASGRVNLGANMGLTAGQLMGGSDFLNQNFKDTLAMAQQAKDYFGGGESSGVDTTGTSSGYLQAVLDNERNLKAAEEEAAKNKQFYRVGRTLRNKSSAK